MGCPVGDEAAATLRCGGDMECGGDAAGGGGGAPPRLSAAAPFFVFRPSQLNGLDTIALRRAVCGRGRSFAFRRLQRGAREGVQRLCTSLNASRLRPPCPLDSSDTPATAGP